MDSSPPVPTELPIEELKALRFLARSVDDLLEESLRARESLHQTFTRAFPRLLQLTGAKEIAITTLNEELVEQTWHHGPFDASPAKLLIKHPWGVRKVGG